MIWFVIVAFLLLQYAAKQHRACNHYQIGADDDHDHGYKEHDKRYNRVLYRNSNILSAAQYQKSKYTEEPIALGRLFAGAFAVQQADGA